MLIKKRGKPIFEVLTIKDFESFIVNESFYKYFIKFDDSHKKEIQELIEKTDFVNYKQVKPTIKSILKYPDTIYDKKFLKCMGWGDQDIKNFIVKKQKQNSKKLSDLKKNNPDHYKDKTTTNVEYWVKKGYSIEESKNQIKQRQSTFSLEKCVQKYGKDKGREVFDERQNKWIRSLKNKTNYSEIQKSKSGFKYNEKSQSDILRHSGFKEKINNIVTHCTTNKNINDFIDCVLSKDDIKRYSDLSPYISSKIIQNFYQSTSKELKNIVYSKINLNQNRQYYGIPTYHNGIRYKSVGEYRVALFLEKNNLNFVYETNYPNSNMKCDFYLPKENIYIEFFGLLNGKNLDKLDRVLGLYKEKMNYKIKFCVDNDINLIYDLNENKLIGKIKSYYEG